MAVLNYRLTSTGPEPVDASIAFSLLKRWTTTAWRRSATISIPASAKTSTELRRARIGGAGAAGLYMTSQAYTRDDPRFGSLALLSTTPSVTYTTGWLVGR